MAKASIDWNALESAIRKSFSPAAPIDQRQLFAGRNAQIKRLLYAISERGRHAVLYGERGVGKTSLTNIFHMLIEGTEQRVLPIRVQSAPQDDYVSLWRKVLREITYPVTENQGYGKETTVSRSFADPYTDKITADDVVRSLRSLGNSFSVVVIFDEFDKIDSIETKKNDVTYNQGSF